MIRHLLFRGWDLANSLFMGMCLFHPHRTVGPVAQVYIKLDRANIAFLVLLSVLSKVSTGKMSCIFGQAQTQVQQGPECKFSLVCLFEQIH